MPWVFAGSTLPDGDEPLWDSEIPEEQEDIHSEFQPIGANATNSTIITYLGTPSIGAAASGVPFRMRFRCRTATKDLLKTLKRTTFAITDPWGVSRNAYLKKLSVHRAGMFGGTERWHVVAELLGR